jgi:DNA-binding Lrp family transcriptional regulator
MNLSDDEKKVLSLVTLRSDLSVRAIARRVGMRDHKVKYILKKLGDDGVYYSYPFVNFHRLGYLEFNLFIAVKGGKGAARQKLISKLQKSPAVKHVGVTGGEYQIDAQVWTRSLNALRDTVDSIARDAADVEYQVDTLLVGSTTYFSANFLGVGAVSDEVVIISSSGETYEADELDRRIIQGLFSQKVPNVNLLGKTLGISQSTLRGRFERLKKHGVLLQMGFMLNHLKIGFTHVTVLVKAKRPSRMFAQALGKFCIKSRAACFLVECYGSWDYQVGVLLPDPTKLSMFVDSLLESLGDQINRVVPVPNFETVTWRVGL